MRESGVVERLSDTVQNGLINIVTIFLGLSVGAKLVADKFLQPQTLGILLLGVVAFGIGTAAGVLMAKLLNLCSKNKINPLIGSAGVSAVPMAARVSNKVGLESDPQNFLLMHAMGPNVADKFLQPQTLGILLLGVVAFGIGTAAGVLMAKLLNLCSKNKINPLIGSAGGSAVPMAARVSNKVGLESDPQNFLLMHAMGPNVAGVIGSAIAAGVMLKYVLAM